MYLARYMPSVQFIVIALSLFLSGGLVYAADYVSHPHVATATITSTDTTTQMNDSSDWEAALYAIQASNASTSIIAPSESSVNQLLQAAQSPTLTETVGKSLFINLSSAKSQGLGDDIPTQEQLIAQAQAQIQTQTPAKLYKTADLKVVPSTPDSLHTFGNAVIQTFNAHPAASQADTFLAIGNAVDASDQAQLQKLTPIKTAYKATITDLLTLPVPQTIAPLFVLVLNDLARATQSYDDMQAMLADPLRGIAGFQTYQASLTEASRLFTNIAQVLSKDGILFNKGEPGNAWGTYLSPQ